MVPSQTEVTDLNCPDHSTSLKTGLVARYDALLISVFVFKLVTKIIPNI